MAAITMEAFHLFSTIAHQSFKAGIAIFAVIFVNGHSVRLKADCGMAAIAIRFVF